MPRSAVPQYLGQYLDERLLKQASPGLRFHMYLPIWTNRADQEQEVKKRSQQRSPEAQEVEDLLNNKGMDKTIAELQEKKSNRVPRLWQKNDFAAQKAWECITHLNDDDRTRMAALAKRQQAMIESLPESDTLVFDRLGTAPFITGMGNKHPLENGFAFLDPYGLPYLPGSGVKGVLRAAARELAHGDWGDPQGWKQYYEVKTNREEIPKRLSVIDLLFGTDPEEAQRQRAFRFRGLLDIWDVIPQVEGDQLMVEIMTPHQSKYYRGEDTPHESDHPTPIPFLAVPPGSRYMFCIRIDRSRLRCLGLEASLGEQWQDLLQAAMDHAGFWLGFGAKTSQGYGVMQQDPDAERHRQQDREERKKELQERREAEQLAAMTPEERERREAQDKISQFRKKTAEASSMITSLAESTIRSAASSSRK